MRKLIPLLIVLSLFAGVVYAIDKVYLANKASQMVNPGQLHTAREAWIVLDATTSTGDEPNDLAVGERTYLTLAAAAEGGDDEIATLSLVPYQDWSFARFRCIGITNDQTVTYQIYLGSLSPGGTDCALVKAGQLAFTIGQQVSTTATYEYADTLTLTEYCWPKTWATSSPTSDLVAEACVDLMGADYIVAVPTTVSCDCKLLIKGY